MTTQELISLAIERKPGNKELALHRLEDGTWRAGIGNTCIHVWLGESEPEYSAEGASMDEALQKMIEQLPVTETSQEVPK